MLTKHHLLFVLITLLGSVCSLGIWLYWNHLMYVIGTSDFNVIAPQVIGIVFLLICQAALVGMIGILYTPSHWAWLYLMWGIPLLFLNYIPYIGIVWLAIMAIGLVVTHLAIQRNMSVFIRPILYRILPPTLRWWFFFVSIILSGSLILNPQIHTEDLNVVIPDTVWSNVWEFIGVQLPEASESSQYVEAVEAIDRDQLPPEQQVLFDEYVAYTQGETEDVSWSIKQEVEQLLNDTLDPVKNYWVYIIAVSFFISAQLLTPLLSIGAFVFVEIMLFLLLRLHVIRIHVQDAQIERYVLE